MTTYATILGLIGSLAGLVALFAWLWARARWQREVVQVELALERGHSRALLQTIADAKASQGRLLGDLAQIEADRRVWDAEHAAEPAPRPGGLVDFGGPPPPGGGM